MVKKEDIEALISKITDKIMDGYHPQKIILFGSYAYGNPDKDSDIDLFIVKDTPHIRAIDRRLKIRRLLREENRKISISPLVYTSQEVAERLSIGDDFVKEIVGNGKILYAS